MPRARPAFLAAAPLARAPAGAAAPRARAPPRPRPRAPRRAAPAMLGPLPLPPRGSALFRSELVRAEAEALERDHRELVAMGEAYGKFDREGKVAYVRALEGCVDRWLVLLKRFQLDDGFEARMYVSQLAAELAKHGMTVETLARSTRDALANMGREAERE